MTKTQAAKAGLVLAVAAVAWFAGCRAGVQAVPSPAPPAPPAAPSLPAETRTAVTRTGYTIQVGAFAVVDNARRLTQALNDKGLDAFYFPQGPGLYKVRIGDFPTRTAAEREAKRLRAEAAIGDYFIVRPEDYPVYGQTTLGRALREKLATTAESFIGVDYTWGGTTRNEGFDCSGLVLAVYRLNGLSMPRSLTDQYKAGRPVSRGRLLVGDLVFFSASPGGALTHVGICVGKNAFIHAPGTGKQVREDSLDSAYFRKHFSGARTYLD